MRPYTPMCQCALLWLARYINLETTDLTKLRAYCGSGNRAASAVSLGCVGGKECIRECRRVCTEQAKGVSDK